MSFVSYGLGWLVLAAVAAPAIWASHEMRRLLVPAWRGAWAALAVVIGTASLVLLAAEIVGIVGLLRPLPLSVFSITAWCCTGRALRSQPRRTTPRDDRPTTPDRVALGGAVVAVAAVLAQWAAWTGGALRRGITGFDALDYHSPFAVRFAQTGSVIHLHNTVPGEAIPFYPANSELWHAITMVAFHRDVASVFVNDLALVVALLAVWAFGRRFGGAPAALVAVALVAAAPYFAYTSPGSSNNDAPAFAALVAAVVLLARVKDSPRAWVFAALASGLAVGTKLSFLAPALLVAVAATALAPQGRRKVVAAGWGVLMAITGGYWFVRDAIAVGSPLPGLDIGLGGWRLAHPALPIDRLYGSRLLTTIDPGRWQTLYEAGLREYFGRGWWAVVLAVIVGIVTALVSRGAPWYRAMGLVSVACLVAYTVTPATGDAVFFRINIRYTIPLQALALLLLATAPRLRGAWAQRTLVVLGLAGIFTAFVHSPPRPFDAFAVPPWPPDAGHRVTVVACVVAIGLLAAVCWSLWHVAPRRARPVGVIGASVLIIAGIVIAGRGISNHYLAARYRAPPDLLGPAWRWAQGVHHARIAVAGLYLQYPFAGADLTNTVQYVGVATPHHGFADAPTCAAWRSALNAGHYRYVVTSPGGYFPPPGEPPQAAWTRADPAAHQILRYDDTEVFELTGKLNPGACAAR